MAQLAERARAADRARAGRRGERAVELTLLGVALTSTSVLALIALFIFTEGLPILGKVGVAEFLFGLRWAPTEGSFGIWPMVVGSLSVTLGALVVGLL